LADPVLIHVGNARVAGRRYGVDPADILGVLSVESGTSAGGAPVEPGDHMGPPSFGQFTFATGRRLGVHFGDSRSETDAIARYLVELGYHKDRRRALAAYNGGAGNPQFSYADKVIAAAKRYAGAGGTTAPSPAPSPTSSPGDGQGDGVFDNSVKGDALKGLLWVATIGAGVTLAGLGVSRMVGVRSPLGQIGAAA
jgi:hypothetical protein